MMVKQFTITALVALMLLGGCSDSKKGGQEGDAEALIAKTVYTILDGVKGRVRGWDGVHLTPSTISTVHTTK